MDTEKTRKYYSSREKADICSCDYCRNFIDEVRSAYPGFSEYLASLGADIEKPVEIMLPLEPENGYMDYYAVQYLIAGDKEGFCETVKEGVSVYAAELYPGIDYKGDYFIIEAGTFHIKCRTDRYKFD